MSCLASVYAVTIFLSPIFACFHVPDAFLQYLALLMSFLCILFLYPLFYSLTCFRFIQFPVTFTLPAFLPISPARLLAYVSPSSQPLNLLLLSLFVSSTCLSPLLTLAILHQTGW